MPPLLAARRLLPLAGVAAFALAALSLVDMYLPRPYDGVVLESDAPGQLMVADVVDGSGAARAGIARGDRIVGIGREVLRSEAHAADQLRRHRIGESVPYLVETPRGRREVPVVLGPRRIGSLTYLGAALLGFVFFAVGSFVLGRRQELLAARLFYLLSILFLVFLVCRLRPASYSTVDVFVLHTGTLALLLLPATFLHFFLVFPRPLWEGAAAPLPVLAARRVRRAFLVAAYVLPLLVYLYNLWFCLQRGTWILISGAPRASWWLLGVYMVLGLTALGANARRFPAVDQSGESSTSRDVVERAPVVGRPRNNERRGAWFVFLGTLFGLVPFLVFTVGFPSVRHTERYLFYGVAPLVLVPLTFAYAIVRFQLLDIRVILRKSLFYTVTTAVVTALYAGGIAAFNWTFQGSAMERSAWFPVLFALAIVLGLDPLRRRLQGPVDRFFYGELPRLHRAMVELGEALSADRDPGALVHELVEGLPRQVGLHFAALYLAEEGELRRAAGPASLPAAIADAPELYRLLHGAGGLAPIELLTGLAEEEALPLLQSLAAGGVEVAAELASPRRRLGLVLLSARANQLSWERAELELLRGLLAQAAIALETGLLLAERTRQAELEREMEIAAGIQASLLPASLSFAPGWEVAVRCRPARHVGGDFFCELAHGDSRNSAEVTADGNGHRPLGNALVYGDVAGKSVPAALMMMAAHEVLHSLALTDRGPEELLALANRRLYQLRRRSFVALGYLAAAADSEDKPGTLRYVLAGQPGLLLRRADGRVEELPLCRHRVPLGALADGDYSLAEVAVGPGELVLGYSDGVLDARAPAGDFFGAERLAAALAVAPADADGAVDSILAELAAFTRGEDPFDDVTLLAVGRRQEVPPDA
ncbi:MAG TPA: SpoIIE family protein phosphatase [Thermoanaerobaculia bacterium]|jgi:serine phosphatase RsbU (regulator of sigma subunit)|nr:SpoIIE family protein phosphatase [Thermoanaerobaculia bacterium]